MGKRQHYIPQFYLKFFSSDKKTVSIFLALKKLYRPRVPIKSILYESFLYDDNNSREERISHLESMWNASLSAMIQDIQTKTDEAERFEIDEIGLLNLYSFICFTLMRTQQQINGLTFQSETFLNDFANRLLDADISSIPELLPLQDPYLGASLALDNGVRMLPLLLDLKPVFLVNKTSQEFITSDSPIVPFNPFFQMLGYPGETGLGNSGLQIYCPLTPQIAVLLYDQEIYEFKATDHPTTIHVDRLKDVRSLNKLIVDRSYSTIVMTNDFPQCEIKGLCKQKTSPFTGITLDVCAMEDGGVMYCNHMIQIHSKYLIPALRIRPRAFNLSFPNNAAGPMRSSTEALLQKADQKIPPTASHAKPFISTRIGTYTPDGFVAANRFNGPKGFLINPCKSIY